MLADCKVCDLSINCVKKVGFAAWSTVLKLAIDSSGFSMASSSLSDFCIIQPSVWLTCFLNNGSVEYFSTGCMQTETQLDQLLLYPYVAHLRQVDEVQAQARLQKEAERLAKHTP